jgi:thiol-disulfide isomerase/thioredoxin
VHTTDTSFAGIVNWIVNLSVDSNRYGEEMPLLNANDLSGISFDRDSLSPIVFYNFWFISCHPCIAEIPMYDSLAYEYKDSISFVAVTFENKEDIKDFLKKHQFRFQHLLMNRSDLEDLYITRLGYPTTIITYQNKIVYCNYGGVIDSSKYFTVVTHQLRMKFQSIFNDYLEKERNLENNIQTR